MILKENRNKGAYNKASEDGFYLTKEWQILRLSVLKAQPFCVRCIERGYSSPAKVVNHIRPIDKHPELRLDLTNLEPLCERCHQIVTRQENSRYNRFNLKAGEAIVNKLNDFN